MLEKTARTLRRLNSRRAQIEKAIAALERLQWLRANRSWGTPTQHPLMVSFRFMGARPGCQDFAGFAIRCRPATAADTKAVKGTVGAPRVA